MCDTCIWLVIFFSFAVLLALLVCLVMWHVMWSCHINYTCTMQCYGELHWGLGARETVGINCIINWFVQCCLIHWSWLLAGWFLGICSIVMFVLVIGVFSACNVCVEPICITSLLRSYSHYSFVCYVNVSIDVCFHQCICVCVYVCVYTCMCMCVCMCVCVCRVVVQPF